MEYNNRKEDKVFKKIQDIKKISMEQYKSRMGANKFSHINTYTPNRNKRIKFTISDSEIKKTLHQEELNIPGLQDDSSSNQTTSAEQSTENIFLAATKSPDWLTRKKKEVEEPEILTLSSDEEDAVDNDSKPIVRICKKEPIITNTMKFPVYHDGMNDEVGAQVSVCCRSIRLGSHKFVPTERVSFCRESLKFTAPSVSNSEHQITIHVPLACVIKILCYLEPGLTSILIFMTPQFAEHVRQQLDMKDSKGIYFDPCCLDESKKRVIFLIDKIAEVFIKHFRNLYKNRISINKSTLLEELTKDEINDIIVNSSPAEIQSLIKKPTTIESSCQTLLIYPASPSKGRIAINIGDYECLGDEQFLNDVIIDFYLKWLHSEKLPEIYRVRTHIFSTFFYKRLTAKPKKSRKADPHETDVRLTPAQKRHGRVKSWTKGINIFEKDFVLVPINERSHWFLAVICFPGSNSIVNEKRTTSVIKPPVRQSTRAKTKVQEQLEMELCWSDRDEAESDEELNGIDEFADGKFSKTGNSEDEYTLIKHPCILIFDSMRGSNRSRIVSTLREYLDVEYEEKNKIKKKFTKENMEGFLPKVPQQMNYSDCGVYTLQFAESFFDDPIKNYLLPIKTLDDWFPQEVVFGKREYIAKLIQSLIRRSNSNEHVSLPIITFPKKKYILPSPEREVSLTKDQNATGKRKVTDEELQSNDFNPINIPASKTSSKKINLNLSSKTIASSMEMKVELNKYCVPPPLVDSLELIKNSYLDSAEDSQNESESRGTVDDDIYDDLDPTETTKLKDSPSNSTRSGFKKCKLSQSISATDDNKSKCKVPR